MAVCGTSTTFEEARDPCIGLLVIVLALFIKRPELHNIRSGTVALTTGLAAIISLFISLNATILDSPTPDLSFWLAIPLFVMDYRTIPASSSPRRDTLLYSGFVVAFACLATILTHLTNSLLIVESDVSLASIGTPTTWYKPLTLRQYALPGHLSQIVTTCAFFVPTAILCFAWYLSGTFERLIARRFVPLHFCIVFCTVVSIGLVPIIKVTPWWPTPASEPPRLDNQSIWSIALTLKRHIINGELQELKFGKVQWEWLKYYGFYILIGEAVRLLLPSMHDTSEKRLEWRDAM